MPTLNLESARACLQAFEFQRLFVEELGWDRCRMELSIQADGGAFALSAAAEKRGMVAFVCVPADGDALPPYAVRRGIERQVTKYAHEHLIIFSDADRTEQVWQWVRREPGRPTACREVRYHRSQAGHVIFQRLGDIAVSLEEEEQLTLVDVTRKTRKAFDVDRVTKRFYDVFKREHDVFVTRIAGIADTKDRDWYASVMLNRLMFVYFIQKKGFLGGDTDYLRNKLAWCRETFGADRFYSFYRTFLLRLFHEGLGRPRDAWPGDLVQLVGSVPYINGGIFQPHAIETKHADIAIPDEAFTQVFAFFDGYQWHLDDRPTRNDNEINPDVLGYIFEKYINQKEMGAYYTKEDITEYIGRSTIVPRLLDMAKEACAVAFEPEGPVWSCLRDDPDRYIFEPVRRGVVRSDGSIVPESDLPDFVQIGMHDPKARMFEKRYNLGEAQLLNQDGHKLTLPTETWREYVERRNRCLELRAKLAAGEVHEVNDLITYNLDLRQLAQDVVERCGPDLLMAFWRALTRITVLDPTVGSGAFLFAALNILDPLYEACLDHMESLVADADRAGRSDGYREFRDILARMAEHPNRRYYILKTIIVNNLFGVDIMQEAVEICKLRLFLKLAAQVDDVAKIEPLPDIDFNIRCGNTLVGYARIEDIDRLWDEVDAAKQLHMFSERDHTKLKQMVAEYAVMLDYWRNEQLGLSTPRRVGKDDLKHARDHIVPELDRDLRRLYRTAWKLDREVTVDRFVYTHQPFHWFVEFPQAMAARGFDVVIGNPPYVVVTPTAVPYNLLGCDYESLSTRNLFSLVYERALRLARAAGRASLIVPLTALSAERMTDWQHLVASGGSLVGMPFPRRPKSVFEGVEMPVAIIQRMTPRSSPYITASVRRFYTAERSTVIDRTQYLGHAHRLANHRVAKAGSALGASILMRLDANAVVVDRHHRAGSGHIVYYQEACRYWVKAMAGMPLFQKNGRACDPPHGRTFWCPSEESASFYACWLNSSLFYWLYSVYGDCEHVNDALLGQLPVPADWQSSVWRPLWLRLERSLRTGAAPKRICTKQGDLIEYEEYDIGVSKPIIDEIDKVLAEHYGFTDEELDFIINYDIKYRMGKDAGEE